MKYWIAAPQVSIVHSVVWFFPQEKYCLIMALVCDIRQRQAKTDLTWISVLPNIKLFDFATSLLLFYKWRDFVLTSVYF